MKKCLLILLCYSCASTLLAQKGTWTQKNDIGFAAANGPRPVINAAAFSIGNKGYVGTGAVQSQTNSSDKDFAQYDPVMNAWSRKADFGGTNRSGAVSFSIGSKGYIGTGSDTSQAVYTADFWEYDSLTDTWAQKADAGGGGRTSAVGFGAGGKGYIGTGIYQGQFKTDFWQYDPVSNAWTQKADFKGVGREGAVGFAIGGKGYIGTGTNDLANVFLPTFLSDFWEYDPAADTWTQKADFGGGTRAGAVGFSIGSLGYIGTGNASVQDDQITTSFQSDFWQYDPATDTWTKKADFAGGMRYAATGFATTDKGYIGTGMDGTCYTCGSYYGDFWEYDPLTDSWRATAGFGASTRASAVSFTIQGKGYIGMGSNLTDLWEYDTAINSWAQKASFPAARRNNMTGFAIGDKGYAGTGDYGGAYYFDFWEFNPSTNNWTQKADFQGAGRTMAVGFAIGNKGYLGTGTSVLNDPLGYTKDLWEYDPVVDIWTRKADFGGSPRYSAAGFALGGKGYIGTGWDNAQNPGGDRKKDFWQYDPASDAWTQKADFEGGDRVGATGFGLDGNGYLGTGQGDGSLGPLSDLWRYDTLANNWTPVTSFKGGGRVAATSFVIGHAAYLGTGSDINGITQNDLWQFNPLDVASLPLMITRFTAVYLDSVSLLHWQTEQEQNTGLFNIQRSLNGRDFSVIGTVPAAGFSVFPLRYGFTDQEAGQLGAPILFYRLQETDRDGKATLSQIVAVVVYTRSNHMTVFPNPAADNIMVQVGAVATSKAVLFITDMAGRKVVVQSINLYTGNNSIPLAIGQFPAGLYTVTVVAVESSAGKWQAEFIKK